MKQAGIFFNVAYDPEVRLKTSSKKARWIGLSAFLVVAALATMGLRSFFDRPGESALAMVPSNALAVVVLDLQPGPGQLGAFHKLQSSVDGADVGKSLDKAITQSLGEYRWIKDILPHLRHSGVIAFMPGERGSTHQDLSGSKSILILPISDASGTAAILRQHLASDGKEMSFSDPSTKLKIAVIQDNLVIAEREEELDAVRKCSTNSQDSFASLEGYQHARKAIDSDANLMFFISDSTFKSLGKGSNAQASNAFSAPGWFGAGMAVRDTGLALSCSVPMNAEKWAPYKDLEAIQPIRTDLYDHLPAGAYQVAAISQPQALWNFAKDICAGDENTLHSMQDMAKNLNRETGTNLDDPNSPTLKGAAVFATYPASTKPTDGYEILVVVDDSNGAKPADVAEGVRRYAERALEHDGNKGNIFSDVKVANASGYTLSPEVQVKEEAKIVKDIDPANRRFFKGKTITYATVGETVLVSTSSDLLTRAVKAYQGDGALLSHDSQLASPDMFGKDGPQIFFEADVERIAEGANSATQWDRLSKEEREAGQGLVKSTQALNTPGTFAFRAGNDAATIHIFIPLDYDHLSEFAKREGAVIEQLFAAPSRPVRPPAPRAAPLPPASYKAPQTADI